MHGRKSVIVVHNYTMSSVIYIWLHYRNCYIHCYITLPHYHTCQHTLYPECREISGESRLAHYLHHTSHYIQLATWFCIWADTDYRYTQLKMCNFAMF